MGMASLLRRLFSPGRSAADPLRPDPDIYRLAHLDLTADALARPPTQLGKRALYDHAGSVPPWPVTVSRWSVVRARQRRVASEPACELREDHFDYADIGPGVWHLNFAHHDLFVAADTPAFAQDELQVAEHPCLYGLRAALAERDVAARTVEAGRPTPILIQNIPRQLAVDTTHLYGRAFASALLEDLRAAARRLEPAPTNLLAIEAPYAGRGAYDLAQLQLAFDTAAGGFAAARAESPEGDVVIHTGHWGGGAYGGDRALMATVQRAAARAVGVRLVFHAGDDPAPYHAASALLDRGARREPIAAALLQRLAAMGFQWGRPDGN